MMTGSDPCGSDEFVINNYNYITMTKEELDCRLSNYCRIGIELIVLQI